MDQVKDQPNSAISSLAILDAKNIGKVLIALSLYITSLVAANTLGLKLMPFFFGTHLSVAVFSFPIVFLMTDVIGEVYGKPLARMFVWAGFISTALFILYTVISYFLPWSPDGMWAHDSYNQIFGVSFRMSVASLLAFIMAEYQDVFSFFLFKKKWGNKYFWLRSNLSNVWSQFVDSVIFTIVAFAGIYSFKTMIMIIIPWWIYKVVMGALYTPLSYVGLYLLRDKKPTQDD
ncbi:MAG: queuosine precursor transporter [Patescibacteria group bacterium]